MQGRHQMYHKQNTRLYFGGASTCQPRAIFTIPHNEKPRWSLQVFLSEFLGRFTSNPQAFARMYRTRVLNVTPQVLDKIGTDSFRTSWRGRQRRVPFSHKGT